MGIRSIEHSDDPWLHKNFDLNNPIYTGGSSYEAYLRSKRATDSQPAKNILTPGMLDRLLKMRVEFERRFPNVFKNMIKQHQNEKRMRISVVPPFISDDLSYVLELAAAEKNALNDEYHRKKESNEEIDYFEFND